MYTFETLNVVVLAGGVGGAKLAYGLAQLVAPERLTIIGNTGDDFVHLGLTICPDLDTLMYTLAGQVNPETGWGRRDESWQVMAEVRALGAPDWFQLGDRDLATHLARTHWLNQGERLTAVTARLCAGVGVQPRLLPMSDQPAPTLLDTEEGVLPFQEWFVQRRWQPLVRRVLLPDDVRASRAVITALEQAQVVILAPSNPFVSLDPILNIYPIRAVLADVPEVVVAVSPIVAGEAVKGPTARMMRHWGLPVTPQAVAEHYAGLITGFVQDERDAGVVEDLPTLSTNTLMLTAAERVRLAVEVLRFALTLA